MSSAKFQLFRCQSQLSRCLKLFLWVVQIILNTYLYLWIEEYCIAERNRIPYSNGVKHVRVWQSTNTHNILILHKTTRHVLTDIPGNIISPLMGDKFKFNTYLSIDLHLSALDIQSLSWYFVEANAFQRVDSIVCLSRSCKDGRHACRSTEIFVHFSKAFGIPCFDK